MDVGFIFGNIDEKTGKVEADYLDADAKEHLGGLARLQGGGLDLQEELQADGPGVGSKEAAVQPAADARDFADEAELIEDAEQQAAMADVAAAMHQHQLGLVSAALQAGAAAEDENYDFDEEEPRVVGPPQLAVIAAGSPAPPIGAIAVGQTPWAAYRHRVHLPVLGQSLEGEAVLRFSELYGHQGVMAGHVASTDDLRPQPLLFRGQRRQAAELAREEQTEVGPGDEEALLQAADIEVPAGEEAEQDDQELPLPLLVNPTPKVAAPAGHAPSQGSPQLQQATHRLDTRLPSQRNRPQLLAQAQMQQQSANVAEVALPAEDVAVEPVCAGSSDGTFFPVNMLAWEDRISWQEVEVHLNRHRGTNDEPTSELGVDSAVAAAAAGHAAEDRQEIAAMAFASRPCSSEEQRGGGQEHAHRTPQTDIAVIFQQQQLHGEQEQQQQLPAATQFDNGVPPMLVPAAAAGTPGLDVPFPVLLQQQHEAQQPHWGQRDPGMTTLQQQNQQQLAESLPDVNAIGAAHLPGLSSVHAAEAASRTAADSDEEESWALPTGPLLRLERVGDLAGARGGGSDEDRQHRGPMPPLPDMLPVHCHCWEQRIVWEGQVDAPIKLRGHGPILDLNDANQAFELTRPLARQPAAVPASRQQEGSAMTEQPPAGVAVLVEQAAALVIEPQVLVLPVPPRVSGYDAIQPEEVDLWRLQQGLAREREYHQPARRKAGTVGAVRVLHAKLASDLVTLPILNPTPHSQEEVLALALWHTHRGKWWPVESSQVSWNVAGKKKSSTAGPVTITIASLPGVSKIFRSVGLDSRLRDLWKHLLDNFPLFNLAAGTQPLILLPGKPPVALPLDQPLHAMGAIKEGQKQLKLTVAFQDIQLLQTAAVNAVPAKDNLALLRPPNAFTRKRNFSAAEPGHVVLLEFMEQQPPLLNRPGMGAKLVTYYRKRDASDSDHQKLKQETLRWRVGAVQPLGDDDDSPFLGQLARGTSTLSVESGLFRSLAFPYNPPFTDFLLLRTPAGTMQVRELSGTVMVGQGLPMLRVPAPTAREVKDLEERRIYVHVFKHLRHQQAKLDSDPVKQGERASITLEALAQAFPSRPPAMIRSYLKDACDLAVRPVGDTEIFSLKDAARPPSEAELRKKLTPEEACTLEACYVAAFRMKQRGLVMHEKLDKAAIEKLRLAAEMLPPDESHQKAARLVEQAMQSAPWTLTDAFVTHFREGKAQLQLAGAADPTGRGFGYSFVRDVRHKHANADDVTKQMAKRQAGKVQGTDADLRRMTTAQAKERLRGYGMTEEEIQGLGRWTMIDMVRQLASAAAQDGTVDAAAVKFVRHQKTTMIELQRRAAEKAQQILEKQMAVLNNSAGEDLGDQDALEAELEQELAAAEEAAEAEGGGATSRPTPQSKKGKREGTPTADDEQRMMQQMRAEGLMDAAAGAGATDAGTAAAAPSWTPGPGGAGGPAPKEGFGTKRIRREVFLKAADGSWQKSHEIVYMGRDRPGQLHSLYQKEGSGSHPYGFGTRTIAGRPKELRLSYAAARGRGMGRSGSRPGPSARGRGAGGRGRGGKTAAVELASPDPGRARQSSRQRKQRQFGDEMLEGEEIISDEGDFEYNDDAEAPYFAAPTEDRPKQQRRKKKKQAAGAAGLEGEQLQPEGLMPALPDDFAAALAAATAVRMPSSGTQLDQQQAPAEELPTNGPGPQQAAQGPPPLMHHQQQTVAATLKPKLKLKLSGAAPTKQPPREPSPDFVYDLTVGEDEESEGAHRRRSGKAFDADYEVQHDADDVSDDFVPDEDDDFSESEGEERRVLKKARTRSRNFDAAPLARSGSRRSAGSAGGARNKGASRLGGKASSGARAKTSGGGSARKKRSRSDFEDEFEDEFEEEEEELSDEDEEMFEEEDPGTSDEGATPQRGSKHRSCGGGAGLGAAGQLGTVGRQLGAILSAIVQQLRNTKMPFGYPQKMTKVYELVYGKVPSNKHAPDYHAFVPKSSVIILPEVQKKAKAGRYLSLEQFRADLQQLYNNAVAYNSPGIGGAYGDPYFIELAAKLLEDAEGLIARHLGEIQAVEVRS